MAARAIRQMIMRSRLWLPTLLLPLLAGLCPVAYASPTDPTWLDGLYDDADYDDAIRLLTSEAGSSDDASHARVRSTAGLPWVAAPTSSLDAGVSRAPYHLRAPPLD